jgi:hypothetical protein
MHSTLWILLFFFLSIKGCKQRVYLSCVDKNTSSLTEELKEGAANEKIHNFGDILRNAIERQLPKSTKMPPSGALGTIIWAKRSKKSSRGSNFNNRLWDSLSVLPI